MSDRAESGLMSRGLRLMVVPDSVDPEGRQWLADPTGRHPYRARRGEAWTDLVRDSERSPNGTDAVGGQIARSGGGRPSPLGGVAAVSVSREPGWYPASRYAGEGRWLWHDGREFKVIAAWKDGVWVFQDVRTGRRLGTRRVPVEGSSVATGAAPPARGMVQFVLLGALLGFAAALMCVTAFMLISVNEPQETSIGSVVRTALIVCPLLGAYVGGDARLAASPPGCR